MKITVIEDRYSGCYSRGAYTAWPCDVPEEVDNDDVSATNFWDAHRDALIGLGSTPQEALADLTHKQLKDAVRGRPLVDSDGENRAVRMFLAYYGGGTEITVPAMREHLTLAGYPYWPAWANDDAGYLTKGGAQDWLRFLFTMETAPTS